MFIYLYFLSFLCIKGVNIKMSLISVEGYENANIHCLKNNTVDLWVSMKDVGVGLGVKSISDLVLKEVYSICEKKKLTKEETKCYKMTEGEFFKKFYNFNKDELE